jgi:Tol biopolymer transport system component
MTSPRRFESDLPALLADLYLVGTPDYRDELVQQTARVRQRPAWTFPERWIPVELVTTRVPATRLPMRQLGVLALIAILLAAMLAVYIGSRQTELPPPFGQAGNGLIAYEKAGDIFTVDPNTNVSTLIVSGNDIDSSPRWSRDGTRLAFLRQTGDGQIVYVMDNDGRNAAAMSDPQTAVSELAFSPDGSIALFTAGSDEQRDLWVANTTGRPEPRRIDVGMSVSRPTFRPPDGSEIVFASLASIEEGRGLYAVNVETLAVRQILPRQPGISRDSITVSPDGSRIAFSSATVDPNRNTYAVHIVGADGTGEVTMPMPDGATFQDAPVWSNDGMSVAVTRGYADRNTDMVLAAMPADGSSTGIETEHGLTGCCDTVVDWAPDDTTILVQPFDLSGRSLPQLLWNPGTGETAPASWAATSDPAWQRVAR